LRPRQPITSNERLAYSVAKAAELLGVSVRTVRYLLQQGRLGFCRLGRRVVIPHADIERLLRQAYVGPVQRLDADEPIRPAMRSTNKNPSEAATSLGLDGPCGEPQVNAATPDRRSDRHVSTNT
jgi:excisionase family DNA binding protein